MGGIANSNLFDLAQERVHESIIDAVLYVDTCSSSTILTAVDVTTDKGSIGSGFDTGIQGQFAKLQSAERSLYRWFENDGIASSEGRANLPGGHHKRIVPGGQRCYHADWLAANDAGMAAGIFAGSCTGKVTSSTRKEVKVIDGKWHIAIARQFNRFASILRLQFSKLFSVCFQE